MTITEFDTVRAETRMQALIFFTSESKYNVPAIAINIREEIVSAEHSGLAENL